MSISREIMLRVGEGRLVVLTPRSPMVRRLYLSADLAEDLDGTDDDDKQRRMSELRAHLEIFADGSLIPAGYMKKLRPYLDDVWEIRSREPKPSLRVFGRFSPKDRFLAFSYGERKSLGEFANPAWRSAIQQAKTDWNNMFPAYRALKGDKLEDVIDRGVS